jgi:hypothetical protein
LIGYCIPVIAKDANSVRSYAKNYLGRIWCSVYEEQGKMKIIGDVVRLS